MRPETRYAHSGDVNIAYQVVGEGPRDLVVVPGWVSNIDLFWDEPHVARFLERLASFSRLILFDKRGTGLSDRVADMPTLETRMDDVRAVMDVASSEQAALFGYSEGARCARCSRQPIQRARRRSTHAKSGPRRPACSQLSTRSCPARR
jgi:pimeloyl-ACP methyl ester carboxylesterase